MGMAERQADELSARIGGLAFARDGWTAPARADALARLMAQGLPMRRHEYWRYTDPALLNAAATGAVEVLDTSDEPPLFDGIDCLKLTFVDGVFDPAASDDLQGSGLEIALLSRTGTAPAHWAKGIYGRLEAMGQTPVARPFAAMNTAFATEGVLIRASGVVAKPVSIILLHSDELSDVQLHHCIRVEAGAELTLLENGAGAARLSTVMEVEVAEGGRFHHIRAQGRDRARRAVTHVFADVGAGALFKSFTLTANGALTRNEAFLTLSGEGGIAHLAGAAVGDGRFHHDDTVFVTHAAVGCESRQVFKKVLKNGAVGVFQGKILVHSTAQKTDGYQISQSLLLDEDSQFLAKPELEIYADDVKCSHGSTSGAIDPVALFYLRSRGVPEAAAKSLLVLAFLAESLAEIADAAIAEDIRRRLEGWLSRHGH
jgi:Fe-S cluster assembly protein SufD